MPWRKTKDPYPVLLSEYMLQQTTVSTVLPYFNRFLRRFPTLKSLAESDLNDVLAMWSGLGYYARARNLWSAAKAIQDKYDGKIPSDVQDLEALPGVGPYTAGAISAFAFNKPAIVLDGNITRVLMRLLGIEDDPKLKAVQTIVKKLSFDLSNTPRQVVTSIISRGQSCSKDINLALMDVGATICLPQNPHCGKCPVEEFCLAKRAGRQNEIPLKGETPDRPKIRRLFAALHHDGEWLVARRPPEGLFGGLWEFIGVDAPSGVDPIQYLEEAVLDELGYKVRVRQAIPMFEHQLTHRVFVVRTFLCDPLTTGPDVLPKKGVRYDQFKWVSRQKLTKLGISSITQRILSLLSAVHPA
ncbi:MAG: Adenine DNA glycosylase [Elusimicrobia bacterium]|nr:Adenine DNA glycosylase [Elusimicrobiota bacterium]